MKVLILDDDLTLSLMLKTWLSKKGYEVRTVINVAGAKKELKQFDPALLISDLRLPDDTGLSLLKWVKKYYPDIAVIMMTSYADIQTAVEAIRLGAYDYIPKPVNPEELLKKIQLIFSVPSEGAEKSVKSKKKKLDFIVGQSPEYQKVYEHIDLVASSQLSVFIEGESGVGKEHIARLIHEKSDRSNGSFVPIDCGVMNRELSASDFFGHIKGSFTGAISDKKGHFEEANKGTLFLDEIGNLPIDIQIQLLRTLQEKKIKQVGSNKEIDIDVRIIVATNEDLEELVKKGEFRKDLYYRINEFHIRVPALRDCKEDIPSYAHHFLALANQEMDREVIDIDEETLQILQSHPWPGNIRELRNVIFRMVLIAQTQTLTKNLLPYNYA